MECITCKIEMFHQKWDLHWCPECNLFSSDIPPDLTMYDKSYCVKYQRYERSGINEKLQKGRHATVADLVSGGRLLDFGCGSGAFLQYANSNGFSAEGFDINPHSGFTDLGVLFLHYDAITFWDVLEHLKDPLTVLTGLQASYIFTCTPNAAGLSTEDLLKWHHYYPGEHAHYFNPKSLEVLFNAAGYAVRITHFLESRLRTNAGRHGILTMGGEYIGTN